jgi:hypothetical protein
MDRRRPEAYRRVGPDSIATGSTKGLNIDHAQRGVGGINSWGARPLERYRLKADAYDYFFVLRPVRRDGEEIGTQARRPAPRP